MIDVRIPEAKFEIVSSDRCEGWLVHHVEGSAIGHMLEGQFFLTFSNPNEAEAFRAVWLTAGE